MIISVINKKGGVGKTPISFSLAKDLGYELQSNDNSVIETIYPDKARIGRPILQDGCVYDFGGFVDSGVLDIIKASNAVIVPCSIDYNALMRTVETIEEIIAVNSNIIVVITKTEKESDFETFRDEISSFFEDLYFLELRNSKIFKNSMETGKTVTQLYQETPLSKSAYRTVYQQYQSLIELFNSDK
jgi:cellulose biosynthesis protein BcsQ